MVSPTGFELGSDSPDHVPDGVPDGMPDGMNVAAGRLRAGAAGAVIVDVDPERRARLLDEAVMARSNAAHCLRIGNPLRAPLTLERILFQIAGDETDLSIDGNAALLTRLLSEQGGPVLLAIDQAETLHLPVLHVLQQLLAAPSPQGQVQLLLAGDTGLLTLLRHSPLAHKLAGLREQLGVTDGAPIAGPPDPEPDMLPPAKPVLGLVPEPGERAGPVVRASDTPPASNAGPALRPVMLGSDPPPRFGWGDERPDFLSAPYPGDEFGAEPGEHPDLARIRAAYPMAPPRPPRQSRRWWWIIGVLLLLLVLVAAGAYAFRTRPELQRLWDPAWPAQWAAILLRGGMRLREWVGGLLIDWKQWLHRQ